MKKANIDMHQLHADLHMLLLWTRSEHSKVMLLSAAMAPEV